VGRLAVLGRTHKNCFWKTNAKKGAIFFNQSQVLGLCLAFRSTYGTYRYFGGKDHQNNA
jgi:hypothetical protein